MAGLRRARGLSGHGLLAEKAVVRQKRAMTEEQRKAVAERMRKYWASRRAAKAEDDKAPE